MKNTERRTQNTVGFPQIKTEDKEDKGEIE
ncbi:hypothetical protein SAMD00079811_05130 [Scytonema sp. HK-05]|nr:hypothetical protein SAMD00079811_05130 [Scytonema sp. HK-05]